MEYQLMQKLQYIENIGLKIMADMEELNKQLSNLQSANRTTQTIARDSATEVKEAAR